MAKKAAKKPVKKRRKQVWTLFASYPAPLYFTLGLDQEIEKAARKHSDGSGMALIPGGYRDMNFSYPNKILATNASKRIKKIHKDIKIQIERRG